MRGVLQRPWRPPMGVAALWNARLSGNLQASSLSPWPSWPDVLREPVAADSDVPVQTVSRQMQLNDY